ncbi:hypothetical protein FIE12Z_7943 [Fusarium flagelliforme]|uniref:Uncharacterized protein n=1 Tax=Fusarium flagelliforme TaxID=2675880 RepID=A0A395MJH3_9HYPO|nr:hypothetical protein FIE12Z_7943 [Fusarium flagelliforme]
MYIRVKLVLILSLFTSWSLCFTEFVQPPERDTDERTDQDVSKNKRYADGDTIPIIWDTNVEDVDLYIWQVIGAGRSTKSLMKSSGRSNDGSWKAQYDISNATENKEDCIYWFSINVSKSDGILAESQFVNVSAPKAEETKAITTSMVLITVIREATVTATYASPSEEASSISESSPTPGLSRGGIAGVAVGGTIGGILILGSIGWMIWRRRARGKNGAAPAELPGDYNQDQPYSERPKSELPAEPVVFLSEGPRGPPRVYEAP